MSVPRAVEMPLPDFAPPRKPKALHGGSRLSVISPASPGDENELQRGLAELKRLGFLVARRTEAMSEGYFAASTQERRAELVAALTDDQSDGIIAVRGGYGSTYLLDGRLAREIGSPKCLVGFSDLTSLQIFLWQCCGWTSIYGAMVGAGLAAGPGNGKGYEEASFLSALRTTDTGWQIPLNAEAMSTGQAEGRLLGGCMTLVETTLGTPWELDTRDAILVLEDRGMKPWQVDRALTHLRQAGKFDGVRAILLGDFPDCQAPMEGSPTVQDVCSRILKPLGVPIVFGAAIGHTANPMLTIPLGVCAQLRAANGGLLEILEPAVVE
jgi:muramoyltetrapeptide carboxypeptidase